MVIDSCDLQHTYVRNTTRITFLTTNDQTCIENLTQKSDEAVNIHLDQKNYLKISKNLAFIIALGVL